MTDRKISNFELGALNYFLIRAFLIGITLNSLIIFIKQAVTKKLSTLFKILNI